MYSKLLTIVLIYQVYGNKVTVYGEENFINFLEWLHYSKFFHPAGLLYFLLILKISTEANYHNNFNRSPYITGHFIVKYLVTE